MRVDRIKLSYRLTFQTAFHCGTGFRAGLVHRALARDAEGLLYVPGSSLKGGLRQHATRILALAGLPAANPHDTGDLLHDFTAHPDPVACIFGTRYRPGKLYFDDARLCAEDRAFFRPLPEPGSSAHPDRFLGDQHETRTRVSIARRSGTAQRNMVFGSEYGRAGLRFDGTIYGQLAGVPTYRDEQKTYSLVFFFAALLSLEHLGGGRSTGAGQVHLAITDLTLNEQPIAPNQLAPTMQDYLAHLSDSAADVYWLQVEIATEEGQHP